jgi:hypothetical protein
MSVEICRHYCRLFLQRYILCRDSEMVVRRHGMPNEARFWAG